MSIASSVSFILVVEDLRHGQLVECGLGEANGKWVT